MPRLAVDVFEDLLPLGGIVRLEVRNVNGDSRAAADFDRLPQGGKDPLFVTDVRDIQSSPAGPAPCTLRPVRRWWRSIREI